MDGRSDLGATSRLDGGAERRTGQPARDPALPLRAHALPDGAVSEHALQEGSAGHALLPDEPDPEETADVTRCDWCDQEKPSYEVLTVWFVCHDMALCEDCRECDPGLDRKTDDLRGK